MQRFLVPIFVTALAAGSGHAQDEGAKSAPPNIVFIVADDLGWADVGCYGNEFHETPHIDGLAEQGIRFTDAYAAGPVCSPTRASMLTGRYPARLHLTDYLKGKRHPEDSPLLPIEYEDALPLGEVTLAEALKREGYASGHVGKWHLGGLGYGPEDQGFDVNVGGTASGMPKSYYWPDWKDNPPVEGRKKGEFLTDRLSEEACEFIEQHKDQPFFLHLAHYAVHIPIQAKEEKIQKYKAKREAAPPEEGEIKNPYYAAMLESVDESVGRVLDTLDRLNLADNTIVLFTSDNGGLSVPEGKHTPATDNGPLRAGKGYLYEGGIRVPCIMRWPGTIPAGATCEEAIISNDFFPTMTAAAGIDRDKLEVDGPLDGLNLAPLFANPEAKLNRLALYWHYPHYSNQGGKPSAAIRAAQYKLVEHYETGVLEVYNLKEDLDESDNIARAFGKNTFSLHTGLARWRLDVKAAHMRRKEPNPRTPDIQFEARPKTDVKETDEKAPEPKEPAE